MDFTQLGKNIKQPFAAKRNEEWIAGKINSEWLNENFGEYETATEMKKNTNSEGLKKFFDYLVEEGKLEG